MSTTISPEIAQTLRSLAARQLRNALTSATKTLAATPDDKFEFKPSETSKSIRELVIHSIEGNGYVGGAIGLNVPSAPEDADRSLLIQALIDSTEVVAKGIEAMPDEALTGTVSFFGSEMPAQAFIFLNEWHISRHVSQIDYVQTIYGDLEDHR